MNKLTTTIVSLTLLATLPTTQAQAQSPADLNDLEIAHVAYVADNIDIRYAHLLWLLVRTRQSMNLPKP